MMQNMNTACKFFGQILKCSWPAVATG